MKTTDLINPWRWLQAIPPQADSDTITNDQIIKVVVKTLKHLDFTSMNCCQIDEVAGAIRKLERWYPYYRKNCG